MGTQQAAERPDRDLEDTHVGVRLVEIQLLSHELHGLFNLHSRCFFSAGNDWKETFRIDKGVDFMGSSHALRVDFDAKALREGAEEEQASLRLLKVESEVCGSSHTSTMQQPQYPHEKPQES